MQEDKESVFDAAEALELSIAAMTGMIEGLEANVDKMRQAAGSGYSTATDLADWLVREAGLPFREAHHVTGRAVALPAGTARSTTCRWPNCRNSIPASPGSHRPFRGEVGRKRTSFGGRPHRRCGARSTCGRNGCRMGERVQDRPSRLSTAMGSSVRYDA